MPDTTLYRINPVRISRVTREKWLTQLKWDGVLVPVEPDYEAAAKALWEDETPVLGLPQPWDDQVPDLQAEYIEAARRTVDAAYGIGGDDG